MYGQMTAGSWIYIGSQGILQGTYECFAAIARRRYRRHVRRDGDADRRPRGHGRRPAAGRDDERWRGPRASRSTPRGSSAGSPRGYLDEWPTIARRRARPLLGSARDGARAVSVGLLGNCRRDRSRAARGAASRPTSSPIRRAPTTRSAATSPIGMTSRRPGPAQSDPDEYLKRSRASMAAHCRGDGRLHGQRGRGVRLRQQPPRRGPGSAASSGRSTIPGSCRPTSARCSARERAVSLGRAVRRSARHRRHRSGGARGVPRRRAARPLDPPASERVSFQGLPARICWLGYGERRRLGLRFNEMVRRASSARRS